ncbi:MAG: SusC/RagA family TonB-linked outer membrane protein [Bacteroidales bacterium]|nr:SusC/RagA family TonB-linked outer membrane protein [Bacteroidales bacterium]
MKRKPRLHFVWKRIRKRVAALNVAILLSVLFSLNVLASAYSTITRFTYDFTGMTVREVFQVLEQQSKFRFFYNEDFSYIDKTVNLSVKDENVETILQKIFENSDITYKVLENDLIVLTVKAAKQQYTITGKVIDASTSEPLPGVNVVEKGTTNGTVTSLDGNFSLVVENENAVLVFSYMGYLSEEVSLTGQTVLNVNLVEDITELEEVVVIGYGSVTKRELTGAVSSVKEGDFNPGAVTDVMELVQGKVAGLSITKRDGGDPTKGYDITLRGVTTITGNTDPLVVIDGIPGGSLDAIAPDDIESVDILKDGSAAAIYGTRGTNGVILVTTKRGSKGRVNVEYSVRFFTERVLNRIEVLDSSEYMEMKRRFQESSDVKKRTRARSMENFGYDTDWFDEILQTPFCHSHHLSLDGATEKTNYRVSFDFSDQDGILLNSHSQELRVITTLQQSALNNIVKFNVQLGLTDNKSNPVDYNAVRQTIQRNPTEPVKNPDGSFYEIPGAWQYDNPVGVLEERVIDNAGSRFFGNLGIDVFPFKSLKLSVTGGLNRYRALNGFYMPSYSYPMETAGTKGSANRWAGNNIRKTFESTLEWKKTFNRHNIALLGGYAYEYFVEEEFYASTGNFITDDVLYNNLELGTFLSEGRAEMTSYKGESILSGFFQRTSYSYNNMLFVSASLRLEGSSKFGENNKWGLFPAASVAFDASQFFQSFTDVVELLKIRAGIGYTGNQGLEEYYIPIVRYGQEEGFFYYNGEQVRGYSPISNANPDLKWETKTEYNLGFDWLVLNSRLGGTIDLYIRDVRDLLLEYEVPMPPNLYPQMWANVGTMRNGGIELTVNANPVKRSKFSWDFNLTFDYRKNKVISLQSDYYKLEYRNIGDVGAPGISAWTHRLEEGEPIGNIHTYQFVDIDSLGKWVFKDIDNNDTIDTRDRTIVGNGIPDYYLGFTNTLRYWNFDLSFMLRGMFGYQVINAKRIWHENPMFLPRNVMKTAMDTELWDDPEFSSYYVEDAGFVKIDNITLGYTYPFKNNRFIRSIRAYVTVNNAFVFTNYSGTDPEVSFSGRTDSGDNIALEPGNDNRFDYPSVRTFIIGLNVKF